MLFLARLIILFNNHLTLFGPTEFPMVFENYVLMLYEDGTPMIYERYFL